MEMHSKFIEMGDSQKFKEKKPAPSDLSKNYSPPPTIYTPPEVVGAIIKGIDHLLRKYWRFKEGIFETKVTFLDPAAGMLAFPLGLLEHGFKTLNSTLFETWVEKSFLHNVYSFEIDARVVNLAKEKYIKELNNRNIRLNSTVPLNIFECNSLADLGNSHSFRQAIEIRDKLPIEKNHCLIVMGNPPYAVSSLTKEKWIQSLIEDYKAELNRKGKKRIVGLKGIQDEYVKFLRLGQWKLADQGHSGIMAYIVNNYFIDGAIFRGLRASMLRNFDAIYVINLHGDPKRKTHEVSLKLKDENIFNIQTGACIIWALKTKSTTNSMDAAGLARVFYSEIRGLRQEKIFFLEQAFENLGFIEVEPREDFEFLPLPPNLATIEKEYISYSYMPDIFAYNIIGIQSLHDTLVTHPNKAKLVEILTKFYQNGYHNSEIIDSIGQTWVKTEAVEYHDARDWKIQNGLQGNLEKALSHIFKWQWRGFDRWWVAYDEHLMTKGSSSIKLMQFMLPHQHNLAIGVARVSRKASGKSSVLITDTLADSHFIEGGSGIGDYLFPLKINFDLKRKSDWDHPLMAIHYNFSREFIAHFESMVKNQEQQYNPEDIFYYIYAILWTPVYREKYAFFLKSEFPRIPFPKSYQKLIEINKVGQKLIHFHLLEKNDETVNLKKYSPVSVPPPFVLYDFQYEPETNSIMLNAKQKLKTILSEISPIKIQNIPLDIWEFEIGGLQPLRSWLKARLYSPVARKFYYGKVIEKGEFQIFLNICWAIENTLQIQKELDILYLDVQNECGFF